MTEPRILYALSVGQVGLPKCTEEHPVNYGLFYVANGTKVNPAHVVQVLGEENLKNLVQRIGDFYFSSLQHPNTALISIEKPKDFPDYGIVRLLDEEFVAHYNRLRCFYELDSSDKMNFRNWFCRALEENIKRMNQK